MAIDNQTIFAQVSSGGTVSETIEVKGAVLAGLWCPTVTSCEAYFQGSFDTTSANFVRIRKDDGSADNFVWSVGVGSCAIPVTTQVMTFPYLRVEFSVAQDTRTLALHAKY